MRCFGKQKSRLGFYVVTGVTTAGGEDAKSWITPRTVFFQGGEYVTSPFW